MTTDIDRAMSLSSTQSFRGGLLGANDRCPRASENCPQDRRLFWTVLRVAENVARLYSLSRRAGQELADCTF